MKINITSMQIAVATLGLLVVGYIIAKKKPNQSVAGAAGSAVANAVGDFATGGVIGIGQVFGIPATEQTQCEKDLAGGRLWDASFSCPAGKFIGGVLGAKQTQSYGETFDAGSGNSW